MLTIKVDSSTMNKIELLDMLTIKVDSSTMNKIELLDMLTFKVDSSTMNKIELMDMLTIKVDSSTMNKIEQVDMLTNKVDSSAVCLFRLDSLSPVYFVSLTDDFKRPFLERLGGILLILSPFSLKYPDEIMGLSVSSISSKLSISPAILRKLDDVSKALVLILAIS
jgi:hypothetical protein